ncbi:YkvA family protein [Congregibacter sp.]|uniref:YkvA family protein n=1 Tax=Congregibacter sp. TaxID=2744308 RepID=UPI0039E66489
MSKLKKLARRIKHDVLTVYFVARNPSTPILVKLIALAVAACALSPIDLIPDFIPVLGYWDDVIFLPLGIMLVIPLTPTSIVEVSRAQAAELAVQPVSKYAPTVVIVIWLLCAWALGYWLLDLEST